jgi:hypothetical protein
MEERNPWLLIGAIVLISNKRKRSVKVNTLRVRADQG